MRSVLYISENNNKLQCCKFKNNEYFESHDKTFIQNEIFKMLSHDIKKWAFDKNEFNVIFDEHLVVLQDFDLLSRNELKQLKNALSKKILEMKFKKLKGDIKSGLKKIPKKGKVAMSVTSAILISTMAFSISSSVNKNKENSSNYKSASFTLDLPSNNDYDMSTYIDNSKNIINQSQVIVNDTENIMNEKKEELTSEEKIIKKYSDMYLVDYDVAKNIIVNNIEDINSKDSFEIGVIEYIKNYHWDCDSIDKTPIISNLTEEEKEEKILEFANVYGIYDENTLATLIAAHRLETARGTSDIYINANNCGGNMEYDSETDTQSLIRFKTFEIGAECFVRQFLNVKNKVESSEDYDSSKSLAYYMDPIYCGEINEDGEKWYQIVDEIKEEVKEEGILESFCDKYTKN